MGNEMGNNNVSGLQEQEKGEYEAPKEVPNKAGDDDNLKAENQPVTSPKEEGVDDENHKGSICEDWSGNDPDNTKEEVADQSSKTFYPLGKDVLDQDVIVDETASASKNSAETTGNEVQDGRESETAEVQSPDDSTKPPLVLDNTSVDGAESFLLSKDGSSLETHDSVYDENQSKTSDEEIQEQIPIEKEPEPEPKPELEPDTTMIPAPDTDSREEQIDFQSIPPSKDDYSYNTVTYPDSDKSTSEANDQQTHKETLKEKEGDGEMNSSAEITWTPVYSESMASTDQDADQLKPGIMVDAKPAVEDRIVLERNNADIIGSTGTHNSEVKENELENESEKEQDESAFSDNIPKVEKHDNKMQKEEIEFQGEALQDNRKNEEIEVEVNVGETFKTEPDSENGELKPLVFELNLDSEVGPDLQKEVIAASGSVESIQVGNSQSKEKFVVLTDDTNLSENQSSPYVELEIETNLDDNFKNMTMDHEDHEDYNSGTATGEEKHDNIIRSVSEEDKELEKETEVLGEVSVHPTDSVVVDTNSEEVKVSACSLSDPIVEEAAPDTEVVQAKDAKETEMSKPMLLDLDVTEPDTTPHVLSVETHSQDVKQDLTVASSKIQENAMNSYFEQKQENVREVDVAKILNSGITNVMLIDSGYGRESDMELCSPESDESYRTAYEQENLSPIVKVDQMKPSLHFAEQTVATEVLVAEANNKDAKIETETSDTKVKQAVGSLSTELYSTDPKMHDKVPSDERAEVSLETPLLYEEKKISEGFRTNCFGSEINPSKGVSIGNPVAETKFLEKEKCDEMPPEDQILEEKQVITMGRNSSEKLNVPLLNFLKEESYCLESEEKKGKSIGKKVNLEKWNSSDDKAIDTTRGRGGAKRKPKPLFFNICMCCTTEIP